MWWMCSNLQVKTSERFKRYCSVFIIYFEHVEHINPLSLLLTFNIYLVECNMYLPLTLVGIGEKNLWIHLFIEKA